MSRVKTRVIDTAFEELLKLGISTRLERRPGDGSNSGIHRFGPTRYADLAVMAFESLADRLTCDEVNLLNELLFNVRMNQEASDP